MLSQAAAKGVLGSDTLIFGVREELVSSMATREWGRPLALGTVIVRFFLIYGVAWWANECLE